MLRTVLNTALLAAAVAITGAPARAQVEVTQLSAPDAFSTPGRMTGLPDDLWRGTPIETARKVLPLLAEKPLSPAAAALARRVLATGAKGPTGSEGDEGLAGARASALIGLGDVIAAAKILDRTAALDRSSDLSRAAAEAALLTGDTARACSVADSLSEGRGEAYWLRLRAYCQDLAGQAGQAQLTFDLAQSQARDATYGRLMGAKLAGVAGTGAASLRNGLDLALSRDLGLDIAAAKPAPAVAAALSGAEPPEPDYDVSAIDPDIGGLASLLRLGMPPPTGVSALVAAAGDADTKARARLQAAALLVAALSADLPPEDRARIAGFATPEGKAPAGRNLALVEAAAGKRAGEAALLALWTCAEAGEGGPALGDRVRIVHALAAAGLMADARTFALEGLAGLK
ncbi:hypothetical protein [Phenylobacterium sp.]|uniref:hypothetical protein n=1 Tax=Phenylobacterium sp. TaxID=1871053 RepID=UPI0025D0A96A|nr:hypothetical protein [Phenylobacterium sp.]